MAKTTYRLGCVNQGRLYFFTAMDEFPTRETAVEYYKSQPRNGAAVVIATIPCVARGVEYGLRHEVTDMAGTPVAGCW
jgi:hypothetical protein